MPLIAGEAAGTRKRTGLGTKMTITRKLTSMATAAALAATALGPMTTAASATEWRQAAGGNYARDWDGDHRGERRGSRHWDGDHDDGPRHHRRYGHRRHKDNTGKYIAIGLGALMLGIIASEAGRH